MMHSGYILPKQHRRTFLYCGALGIGICGAFALWMWHLAAASEACGLVGALFTGLTLWLAFSWIRRVKLVNIRYEIDGKYARNICGRETVQVEVRSRGNTKLRLAMGKGNLDLALVLLTEIPFFVNTCEVLRGLDALPTLWKNGIVIAPNEMENP